MSDTTLVRFGLVADAHYADTEDREDRQYRYSLEKMRRAVKVFNESNLDFVVELGDLKDQGEKPDKKETLSFLDKIETELRQFNGDVYHVLGNHDMDSISKEDFLAHTENPPGAKGKAYYSFVMKGIKFIVLDANYNLDGGDYDSGNFDWRTANIPQAQMAWLGEELRCGSPVIVFIHQMLDYFSEADQDLCVKNAQEITGLLEHGGNVLAVFQGHDHEERYSTREGIQYFTVKGMIAGNSPEDNRYEIVEINSSFKIRKLV
jgi:alkaline phosphatase